MSKTKIINIQDSRLWIYFKSLGYGQWIYNSELLKLVSSPSDNSSSKKDCLTCGNTHQPLCKTCPDSIDNYNRKSSPSLKKIRDKARLLDKLCKDENFRKKYMKEKSDNNSSKKDCYKECPYYTPKQCGNFNNDICPVNEDNSPS